MRVLKQSVPVDDRIHPIGGGKVLLTACQNGPGSVQVWTEESEDRGIVNPRAAIVIGTGMSVPEGFVHIGSAMASSLVWHVYAKEQR